MWASEEEADFLLGRRRKDGGGTTMLKGKIKHFENAQS